MSAFVVDREHVIYLASVAAMWDLTWWDGEHHEVRSGDFAGAAKLATTLWRENNRSVNYRYRAELGFSTLPELQLAESDIRVLLRIDPVQVLKALDCLEYQSCETPDWRETEAHGIIQSLRSSAIRRLRGFDAAAWEINDNSKQAVAS